jgi:lambda family phage portal protein
MSNRYVPPTQSKITQNFQRYFSADPNQGYTFYKNEAQNVSLGLYYETSIGRMIINRLTTKVIGNGLVPMASPETDILGWTPEQTERFQKQVESLYRIITGSPSIDWRGKSNLKEMQTRDFKMTLTTGDILLHLGYRKKGGVVYPYVQTISGKLVGNPAGASDTKELTGGVKLDSKGQELGYYIMVPDANRNDTFDYTYVSRYNPRTGHKDYDLVQLCSAESNQIRGIPYLSALRDDILQLVKLKDLHLTKAIIQTIFTVAVERQKGSQPATESLKDKLKYGVAGGEENAPSADRPLFDLGPGVVVELEDGETLHSIETALNSTDFSQTIRTNLEIIGSAVGIPYEELLGSYNSSFSASRATINDSEKFYKVLRSEFISKYLDPIYQHVVDYCITAGLVDAPGYFDSEMKKRAVLACTWTGTTPTQVDPVKEVNAFKVAIDAGLCTREYATRSLYGMDFEEVSERLRKEQEQLGAISDAGNQDASPDGSMEEEDDTYDTEDEEDADKEEDTDESQTK